MIFLLINYSMINDNIELLYTLTAVHYITIDMHDYINNYSK